MRLEFGRHRIAENLLQTKHVVAAGSYVRDAGSTPAASTTFFLKHESSAVSNSFLKPEHFALGRHEEHNSYRILAGGAEVSGSLSGSCELLISLGELSVADEILHAPPARVRYERNLSSAAPRHQGFASPQINTF